MFRRDPNHYVTKYEKAHARSLVQLELIAAELESQAHLLRVSAEDLASEEYPDSDLIERSWLGYESATYAARQLRKIVG